MVVISIKRSGDGDGFLYETTCDTLNDDLIESLVQIHNKRIQSKIVVDAVRGLAMYGVMKPPAEAGLDKTREKYEGVVIDKGEYYTPDPTGIRTGNGPEPKLKETLECVAQDLEEYIDKNQVQKRKALTNEEIDNKIANVKGAVMMAYPMGLPEWETLRIALNSVQDSKALQGGNEILEVSETSLWVAGKEFHRGQLVSDRLGHNEKTKVIAKLQTTSSGPPSREPAVTEEERKAMMAHYFKRQEELKRLAEANEDDYLNSSWADPKGMKRSLQGLNDVKAPGVKF